MLTIQVSWYPRTSYARVMTNSLVNLICYFLALSTTLSTATVVRDVFDGHSDTVSRITRPAVPDTMVVDWRSIELRESSTRCRAEAMQHATGFYLDGEKVSEDYWNVLGDGEYHAGMENNL